MTGEATKEAQRQLALIQDLSKRYNIFPPKRSERAQRGLEYIPDHSETPEQRLGRARSIVVSALRLVREACGEEVLRDAYGPIPTTREQGLHSIAARLHLASYLFLGIENQDPYCFNAVADEATAVAAGDSPTLFATVGKRSTFRQLLMKFDALRWEAYLDGLGLCANERQSLVARAFRSEWPTIRRRWKADVIDRFGDAVRKRLETDRRDGSRQLRRWTMMPGEHWQTALARSGDRYWQLKGENSAS